MNEPLLRLGLTLLVLSAARPALAAEVAATLDWTQRVELGVLVSGVVSEVLVRPGQHVAKGERLVALDRRGFASQVARREAEHRHARALLEEARREDERATELYDRTVLSDFERNQALIALQAARAAAERAQAELVAARLDLEHSEVSAPFDGVVLAVNVAPGQGLVSELQSQPLVTLADDTRLRARALIDAGQAARLSAGQTLRASVRGEDAQATVVQVGMEPVATAGGPVYELLADIDRAEHPAWRVGESATLYLESP